jgi:uncharacterized protein YycO
VLQNCAVSNLKQIHNGDLLFVEAKTENLSGAISRVTKSNKEISFDHVAIIERKKEEINVLEASVKYGSNKKSYRSFLKEHKKTHIVLYRLKPQYQNSITLALSKANSMLGKPYNTAYILNENSYYCSDFIERSFEKANIFELKPMTFINPKTGKTDEFWLNFYKKLGLEVPEGKVGCNPNGLSQSNKIEKIAVLN